MYFIPYLLNTKFEDNSFVVTTLFLGVWTRELLGDSRWSFCLFPSKYLLCSVEYRKGRWQPCCFLGLALVCFSAQCNQFSTIPCCSGIQRALLYWVFLSPLEIYPGEGTLYGYHPPALFVSLAMKRGWVQANRPHWLNLTILNLP